MMTMDRSTHLGWGVTVGQVLDLATESGVAGDDRMLEICGDALECDQEACRQVALVLLENDGQS
jgi:hypothetical protein